MKTVTELVNNAPHNLIRALLVDIVELIEQRSDGPFSPELGHRLVEVFAQRGIFFAPNWAERATRVLEALPIDPPTPLNRRVIEDALKRAYDEGRVRGKSEEE